MSGSIALVIALVLLVAYFVLVRKRLRTRDPWQLLRQLSPVSGQWLADLRRSG
jgi:hypothetical protein